jgi:hypothetical protein
MHKQKVLFLSILGMLINCISPFYVQSAIINCDGKKMEVYANDLTRSNWEGANKKVIDLAGNWRLPTIDELICIYQQLHKNKKGDFKNAIYWSGDTGAQAAMLYDFSKNKETTTWDTEFAYVRPVRNVIETAPNKIPSQGNTVIGKSFQNKVSSKDSQNTTTLNFKTSTTGEITASMVFMGKTTTKKYPFTYTLSKSILTYTYTIEGERYKESFDVTETSLISRDYTAVGGSKIIYKKL